MLSSKENGGPGMWTAARNNNQITQLRAANGKNVVHVGHLKADVHDAVGDIDEQRVDRKIGAGAAARSRRPITTQLDARERIFVCCPVCRARHSKGQRNSSSARSEVLEQNSEVLPEE